MAKTGKEQSLIDTQTAAALIQVTPRRLQQLANEGWITPVKRGRWSLVNVVQGYIAFLKDEQARRNKTAAASAVQQARADEIRLRIAREDRNIIELTEALEHFDYQTGQFISSIDGMPARLTRVPRERQRFEKICDAERQRLANLFAKRRDLLRAGANAIDADSEDDAG